MSREFGFFIYLLARYAEHLGVTADVAYRRLAEKGLVDYVIGMYERYHVEAIENANGIMPVLLFHELKSSIKGGARRVDKNRDSVRRAPFSQHRGRAWL